MFTSYDHGYYWISFGFTQVTIETGRWNRTPQDLRHCTTCNVLGDEHHFIYNCPLIERSDLNLSNNLSQVWSQEDVFEIIGRPRRQSTCEQNLLCKMPPLNQCQRCSETSASGIIYGFFSLFIVSFSLSLAHSGRCIYLYISSSPIV